MRDWMGADVPAVAAWARKRQPGVPQLAIGHSIGGHALALDYGTEDLAGFAMIAAHAGTTRAIPDRVERARARMILSVLGPAFARLMGYIPGRRLGLGEDMPGGPMLEWGRWSRRPGYFFDDPSMEAEARAAAVTQPVLAIGFSDDPWATPPQIDVITDHLVNAMVERRTYSPGEGGVPSIGHMGFFRSGVRDTLWPEVLGWLMGRAESAAR
jgi:predicted alpha/beta hydrolase